MSNGVSNMAAGLGLNAPANVAAPARHRTGAASDAGRSHRNQTTENEAVQTDRQPEQVQGSQAADRPQSDRAAASETGRKSPKNFKNELKKRISRQKTHQNERVCPQESPEIPQNSALAPVAETPKQPVMPIILPKKAANPQPQTNTGKAPKTAIKPQKQAFLPRKQVQDTPASAPHATKTKEKSAKPVSSDRQNIEEIAPHTKKTAKNETKVTSEAGSKTEKPSAKPLATEMAPKTPTSQNQVVEKAQVLVKEEVSVIRPLPEQPPKEILAQPNDQKQTNQPNIGTDKIPTGNRDEIHNTKSNSGGEEGAAAVAAGKEVNVEDVVKPAETVAAGAKPVVSVGAPSEAPVPRAVQNAAAPRGDGFVSEGLKSPGEQVIESIRLNVSGGRRQIDINLHPSELGSVRIRLGQEDGQITGVLEVDRPQTRYEIEKEMPEIVASLQSNGLQVKRVDVVLNQQPSQDDSPPKGGEGFDVSAEERFETSSQDASSSQKGPVGGDNSEKDYAATEQKESRISDDAINVYV